MSYWCTRKIRAKLHSVVTFFSFTKHLNFMGLASLSARSRASLFCVVLGLATVHCGAPGAYFDDETRGSLTDASAADSLAANVSDTPSRLTPLSCATRGDASLQVRVQLAPALPDGDLWVAVYCGTTPTSSLQELIPVRVVRLTRSASMMTMIENLGEGYYRVFASIAGNPSGDSGLNPVRLAGSVTGATFVSVNPASARPLVDSNGPMVGGPDAGVQAGPDAAGAAVPIESMDFAIASPMVPLPIGRLGLQLRSRPDGFVDAAFSLANLLGRAGDPALRFTNIELRVERAGQPIALLSLPLGAPGSRGTVLRPTQSYVTESRAIPSNTFDVGSRFRLTVFGAIE